MVRFSFWRVLNRPPLDDDDSLSVKDSWRKGRERLLAAFSPQVRSAQMIIAGAATEILVSGSRIIHRKLQSPSDLRAQVGWFRLHEGFWFAHTVLSIGLRLGSDFWASGDLGL